MKLINTINLWILPIILLLFKKNKTNENNKQKNYIQNNWSMGKYLLEIIWKIGNHWSRRNVYVCTKCSRFFMRTWAQPKIFSNGKNVVDNDEIKNHWFWNEWVVKIGSWSHKNDLKLGVVLTYNNIKNTSKNKLNLLISQKKKQAILSYNQIWLKLSWVLLYFSH